MNVGRISNLRQTRFAERICNSLVSFVARIGNVAVDRECQDLQPQMDAFHQGFLHAMSQACGLSSFLFELLSVLTFLLSDTEPGKRVQTLCF